MFCAYNIKLKRCGLIEKIIVSKTTKTIYPCSFSKCYRLQFPHAHGLVPTIRYDIHAIQAKPSRFSPCVHSKVSAHILWFKSVPHAHKYLINLIRSGCAIFLNCAKSHTSCALNDLHTIVVYPHAHSIRFADTISLKYFLNPARCPRLCPG